MKVVYKTVKKLIPCSQENLVTNIELIRNFIGRNLKKKDNNLNPRIEGKTIHGYRIIL